MQQQTSFAQQYPMTLETWSQCVDEQQSIYERSQQAVTDAFKRAGLWRFGSPEYKRAWNVYLYRIECRTIERDTLGAISNYYASH